MSEEQKSDAEKITAAIYDLSGEVASLTDTLHQILMLFEEVTAHDYGDPNKPKFIRTCDIGRGD